MTLARQFQTPPDDILSSGRVVEGQGTATPLYRKLLSLRSQFASAAQKVYAAWDQDEEGMDDEYGAGGICQDIADAMADVVNRRLRGADAHIVDNNGMGDQHVWIIVVQGDEKYAVDIPPGTYETGGGYTWKKRKGVRMSAQDVDVYSVSDFDPEQFEAVDEAVKGVRKLLDDYEVFHFGKIGRFNVFRATATEFGASPTGKIRPAKEYTGGLNNWRDKDIKHLTTHIKRADNLLVATGLPRQSETLIVVPIGMKNPITGGTVGGYWDRKNHVISLSTAETTPERIVHVVAHEWAHSAWGRLSKEKKGEFAQWFNRNVGQAATEYARKNQPKVSKASKEEVKSLVSDWWAYAAQLFSTRSLKALINNVKGNRELIDQNPKSELKAEYESDYHAAQGKLDMAAFSKRPREVLWSSNCLSVWEKMVKSVLVGWWMNEYKSLGGAAWTTPDNMAEMVQYAKRQWTTYRDREKPNEDLVGFDIDKWLGVVCQNVILSFTVTPVADSGVLATPGGESIRFALHALGMTPTAYAASDDKELWAEMVAHVVANPNDQRFKKLWKQMVKLALESDTVSLADMFESKVIDLAADMAPEEVVKRVRRGSVVTFDGGSTQWGVETIKKQMRRTQTTTDELDPKAPMKDVRYMVVTVTAVNSWAQRTSRKFGGLDYAHRNKAYESVETTPPAKGKQLIKVGKHGRFEAYSVSDGPAGVYTKQQALDKNLQDTLLANTNIDIPHFLSRVSKAMDKLSMPKYVVDVVFANYPHGKSGVSGWMYPSIKSTVFLNRVLSPTALGKYGQWKGPRSPHTLVHEYAHDVWFQAMSGAQRKAVTDYYNQHVAPDKKAAVQKLISPTDYGATSDTEWWAEIVAYSIHPGRVASEVRDFIVDVMKGKLNTPKAPASKEKVIQTPAPDDVPETPIGKLIKTGTAALKKEVGDYKLDPRPDGSIRIIPANKQKAHDGGVMAKAALALGFNRHGKSPFKVRLSTGTQGGIVLFPESTDDVLIQSVLAEIEDAEPHDYIDEAGMVATLKRVLRGDPKRKIASRVDALSTGDVIDVHDPMMPKTKSFIFRYQRTKDGMAMLGLDGKPMTPPRKQAMMLDYVKGLIHKGARAKLVRESEEVGEGVDKRAFAQGRIYWQAYVNLNGYAFEPTEKGLKKLADKLGVKKAELRRAIHAFLSA